VQDGESYMVDSKKNVQYQEHELNFVPKEEDSVHQDGGE